MFGGHPAAGRVWEGRGGADHACRLWPKQRLSPGALAQGGPHGSALQPQSRHGVSGDRSQGRGLCGDANTGVCSQLLLRRVLLWSRPVPSEGREKWALGTRPSHGRSQSIPTPIPTHTGLGDAAREPFAPRSVLVAVGWGCRGGRRDTQREK